MRAALGPDSDVTIATYHSFGASLVAEHGLELDLAPGTQVLNRAQSWQLLFAVFDEFRFDRRSSLSPEFVLNDALALASRCADHLVPIDAVEADCRSVMETGRWKGMRDTAASRLELCQVVAAYERRKRERNLLDFGDQVGLAVRLLTENPDVAADERRRHPVVLLDEYQDTNFAQRRLLQLLYPPGSAVTAVGDDMQSIYGFRGAHLVNILRFKDHFPPVTVRQLQTTFRFGAALGTLANRIQDQVDESLKKVLRPLPDAPETVIECFLAADDAEEAGAIAADIASRHGASGGGPWSDVAVLCRKRRLIQPIVAALEERRVPVEAVGSSGLLDRPEVVDVVAWLEVLADPSASVALLRLLSGPRYRIGLRDLAVLSRHSRQLAHYDDAAQAEVDAAAAAATAAPDDQPRVGLPLAPPPQVETVLADALGDLVGRGRPVPRGPRPARSLRPRAPPPGRPGPAPARARPGGGHPRPHRPVAGGGGGRPPEPPPLPRPGRALPPGGGRPRPGRLRRVPPPPRRLRGGRGRGPPGRRRRGPGHDHPPGQGPRVRHRLRAGDGRRPGPVPHLPRRPAGRERPGQLGGPALVAAGGRRGLPAHRHRPHGRHRRGHPPAQARRGVAPALRGLHPGPAAAGVLGRPLVPGGGRAPGTVGLLRLRGRPDRHRPRVVPPRAGHRRPRGGGQGAVPGRGRPPVP